MVPRGARGYVRYVRFRVVLGALFVALGTGILVLACYAPTQVTVEITTDLPCARTQGTKIMASTPGDATGVPDAVAPAEGCVAGNYGSLVVVPSGSRDAKILITVVTGVTKNAESCAPPYEGCIVARRSLRFLEHAALRLPVSMRAACVGVPCDDDTTCVDGQCRNARIDPARCTGAGCSENDLPPSVVDAGVDARLDASASADADADTDTGGQCACQPSFCGCGACNAADIICSKTGGRCPLGCPTMCDVSQYKCACVSDRCVLDTPVLSGQTVKCFSTGDCPPGQCCQPSGNPKQDPVGSCIVGSSCP